MSGNILLVALGQLDTRRISAPLEARGHAVDPLSSVSAASASLAGRHLVIVGGPVIEEVADACRKLRAAAGPDLPILAIANTDDIEGRIALFESGSDDVLGGNFDDRELEALADALLARRRSVEAGSGLAVDSTAAGNKPANLSTAAGATGSPGTPGSPGRPGRLIVFVAAKGGAGTTTLAVNTAVALAEDDPDVVIADLDLHHGQVAAHLDVEGRHSTAQLARDEQVSTNPQVARGASAQHASGLHVLTAPPRPDEAALVSIDDVIELAAALRAAFSTVVVDAGSVPATRALTLVALADRAIILVTPDIPGLRALRGMLDAMGEAGVAGDQTRFVLNEHFASGAIDGGEIEQHLGIELALRIPYDGDTAMRAVNEGQPIVLLAPRSKIAGALGTLADMAVDRPTEQAGGEQSQGRGLLGSLRKKRL